MKILKPLHQNYGAKFSYGEMLITQRMAFAIPHWIDNQGIKRVVVLGLFRSPDPKINIPRTRTEPRLEKQLSKKRLPRISNSERWKLCAAQAKLEKRHRASMPKTCRHLK
jgi:hypothetical protein